MSWILILGTGLAVSYVIRSVGYYSAARGIFSAIIGCSTGRRW